MARNVFRRMFNWLSGRTAQREKWLKMPRLFPERYPEGQCVAITREFTHPDHHDNIRLFRAAFKRGNAWDAIHVERDFDFGNNYTEVNSCWYNFQDPHDLVSTFEDYERDLISKGWVPLEGSSSTYPAFGNTHGIHIDSQGHVFRVEKDEKPAAREFFMKRENLNALFGQAAKVELKTWADLYKNIIDKIPADAAPLDDLARDPIWGDFISSAGIRSFMQKVEEHGAYMADSGNLVYNRARKVSALLSVESLPYAGNLETPERIKAVRHMTDATVLLTLLRSGSQIYSERFLGSVNHGAAPDEDAIDIIKAISAAAKEIVKDRFGFREEIAEQVSSIIMQGPDPCGAELPLKKAMAVPPAPPQHTALTDLQVEQPEEPDAPAADSQQVEKADRSIPPVPPPDRASFY